MTRCLFLGSNGAGLGHVTRLLAIARRLPPDVEVVFGSMSQAVPLLRRFGYVTEYIPTVRALGMTASRWNDYLESRIRGLFEQYEPDLIAFDGTAPYGGLVRAMRDRPDLARVWVRRAMWRPGHGARSAARSVEFDLVIEPGELATDLDIGATFRQRHEVTGVRPIVFHDPADALPAAEARAELGLPPDATLALVLLGAGNINDLDSPTAILVSELRSRGIEAVVAESPISNVRLDLPADVHEVRLYPIAPYYAAFDLVVSACGYNSFHELMAHAIPSLLVPNLETRLDDQWARAEFAADIGAAVSVTDISEATLGPELDQLADPITREDLRATCGSIWPGNGAGDAARHIAELLRTAHG